MSVRAVTWSPRWRWSSAFAALVGTWLASRALPSRFYAGRRRRRLGAQTAAAARRVGGTHHARVEQGLRHAAADRGLAVLVLALRGGHRLGELDPVEAVATEGEHVGQD